MDGTGSFSDWLTSLKQTLPQGGGFWRNQPNITPNRVPALWLNFAPRGEALINKQYGARRQGLTNTRREYERNLLNTYQSSGIDPVFARMRLAESVPRFQGMQGDIESERLGDILGFRSGITNALAESNTAERELDIESYLAARARRQARHGAKAGAWGAAIGGGLSGLGSALGGVYGGGGGGAPA